MATPTPADSLPVGTYHTAVGTSTSFSYTVPSGSNLVLIAMFLFGSDVIGSIAATQNSQSLTMGQVSGSPINAGYWIYGYLAAPTSGTFAVSWGPNSSYELVLVTFKDAAQTSPIDAAALTANSKNTNIVTTVGDDALIDFFGYNTGTFNAHGSGQTEVMAPTAGLDMNFFTSSWKPAGASPTTENMSEDVTSTTGVNTQIMALAIKYQAPAAVANGNFLNFMPL